MTPSDDQISRGNNAEPEKYTIVFNKNADTKSTHDTIEANPYRFSKAYEKSIFKQTWFETALWIGGILALIIAIGTIIN